MSRDKEKALDYGNMLAVCDGGKNIKGSCEKTLCCDAKKKDEVELSISPFCESQIDKLKYDKAGFIKTDPQDEKIEKDLNEILGLNGVWKNGKFSTDTATNLDKKGKCTSAQIKKKIVEIEQAEQKQEYAGVLLYFLKKKYHSLISRGL